MNQKNGLLQQEHIRNACSRAIENPSQLQEALELLYREGLQKDSEDSSAASCFARRTMEMYDEFKTQLSSCCRDAQSWLQAQVDDCGGIEGKEMALANGACALAAELHQGDDPQFMDALPELLDVPYAQERPMQLLLQCLETPMQEMFFTWRSYPLLDARQQKSAGCLLAMLCYIDIKTNPDVDMAPDVSFDSVCVLASAVTEVMCRSQEDVNRELPAGMGEAYGQTAAAVCSVMCSQYMWITSIQVYIACMRSLIREIKLFFARLNLLLAEKGSVEEGHIILESRKEGYDFARKWAALLVPVKTEIQEQKKQTGKQKSKAKEQEKSFE